MGGASWWGRGRRRARYIVPLHGEVVRTRDASTIACCELGCEVVRAQPGVATLLEDFESEFFDYGIGEDFFGDAFGLGLGVFAGEAVEIEDEEFALADVFDGVVTEAGEGVLDGLALGIENGVLRHDPNVCFHRGSITKLRP